MLKCRTATAVVSLLALASAFSHAAESEPIFSFSAESKIVAYRQTALGSWLVGTEKGSLIALHPVTGEELWRLKLKELLDSPYAVVLDVLPRSPYAVVKVKKRWLAAVNIETGRVVWDSGEKGEFEIKRYGTLPTLGILVLVLEGKGHKNSLYALDLESGQWLWKQPNILREKPRGAGGMSLMGTAHAFTGMPSVELEEQSAVLYINEEDGPFRLDTRTGAIVWRAELPRREEPRIYHGRVAEGNRIYLSQREYVVAIDTNTGGTAWQSGKYPEDAFPVFLTDAGLLVRGKDYVDVLDVNTGRSIWPKPVEVEGMPALASKEGFIFLAMEDSLVRIQNGSIQTLATIALKGGEEPQRIEIHESKILVSSPQNLAAFDGSGRRLFHTYYPAPGNSILKKIAAVVVAQPSDIVPVLRQRFSSTVDTREYIYMFTESDDDADAPFSYIRVDKLDGSEHGRVTIGDRAPEMRVDGTHGIVVVRTSNSELVAYKFQ